MNHEYNNLLQELLARGVRQENRTGTDTLCLFGRSISVDVGKQFPILTNKKVSFPTVLDELLWFISGSTNIKSLNSKIWDAWAREDGNLGKIYGYQWHKQLDKVIAELRSNPTSRRLVVDSWQIADLHDMQLPPCHYSFVLGVVGNKLNIMVSQRSADVFLGVPYNITSYATLLCMIAKVVGLEVGTLMINFANVHLYTNHIDQANKQLGVVPAQCKPTLVLPEATNIHSFSRDNVYLDNYIAGPVLKGDVAI